MTDERERVGEGDAEHAVLASGKYLAATEPTPMNTRAKVPRASASERRSSEGISRPYVSVGGMGTARESRRPPGETPAPR